MSTTILKFFPDIVCFTTSDKTSGISTSEAQRVKEKNKNEADRKLKVLNNAKLYKKRIVSISSTTGQKTVTELDSDSKSFVKPEDFVEVSNVSTMYKTSAYYGSAINRLSEVSQQISQLTFEQVCEIIGQEIPTEPVFTNKVRQIVSCQENAYYNLERSEELFRYVKDQKTLTRISEFFRPVIEAEAQASIYGKQIHDSSLQKIVTYPQEIDSTQLSTESSIAFRQEYLGYDVKTFESIFLDFEIKHTEFQKLRNKYFKQIKDIVREELSIAQTEYSAEVDKFNKIKTEYQNEMNRLSALVAEVKQTLNKEFSALRIKTI